MTLIKSKLSKKLSDKFKKAPFLGLEGMDGAGKSTCIEALKQELRQIMEEEQFKRIFFTREPGGSPLAEVLRGIIQGDLTKTADPLTLKLLFFAARSSHMEVIREALHRGSPVITDRFAGSTFAYQIHGGEAFHLEDAFHSLYDMVVGEDWSPVFIYLDLPPEESDRRLKLREAKSDQQVSHFDKKGIEYFTRVRKGYQDFMAMVGGHTIDANRPVEQVTADFIAVVRKELGV